MNRRKLIYMAPVIATIAVLPQIASAGSSQFCVADPKPRHGCKHYLHYLKRHGVPRPTKDQEG
jgi:hypothetical protein